MDIVGLHICSIAQDTLYMAQEVCALASNSYTALKENTKLAPRTLAGLLAAVVVAIVALALALEFELGETQAACPIQVRQVRPNISGGPAALLARAYEEKGSGEWTEASKGMLKQVVEWKPAEGFVPPLPELRAQLQGHDALVATMDEDQSGAMEAMALVERTKDVLAVILEMSEQCESMLSKLHQIRRTDTASLNPSEAIVALSGIAGFEKGAREALTTLKSLTDILEQRVEAGDWDAEDSMHEVPPLRIKFRSCLLKTVREARAISISLPKASAATKRAQQCRPELLVPAERLAFDEAESEADPGVIFSAGLLMSEVSVTPEDTPFFGQPGNGSTIMVEDSKGVLVPLNIMKAEEKLLQGFAASVGPDGTERAALSAIRLCQHAKYLMNGGNDAAAEWRYRAGAELAGKHGRTKLASHSLAQLSYFFSVGGREESALQVANEALEISYDPLASYLQTTMGLKLGSVRTDEEARAAAAQLMAVEDKLPMKHLEESRSLASANLASWGQVSDADTFSSCLGLGDVSQVLICLTAKIAYMHD